jgi:hypothetical protein
MAPLHPTGVEFNTIDAWARQPSSLPPLAQWLDEHLLTQAVEGNVPLERSTSSFTPNESYVIGLDRVLS